MVDTTTTQHTGNTTPTWDTPAQHINAAVELIDGRPMTTSLAVAERFGKRHDDVLRRIRSLDCSPEFRLRNFAEASQSIEQPNGGVAKYPVVRMTRDGFTFLCMGFTGKEAAKFKEAYIDAFNQLEAAQVESAAPRIATLPAEDWDQVAFAGKRIRVVMRDGQPWFAAANVAVALGLRSSGRITRAASRTEVCTTKRGRQSLNFLSPSAAFRASDYAEHERGARWRSWLARTLGELQQGKPPAPPVPQGSADPADLLRGMIGSNRFLCHLDERGRITLREIPQSAVLANVEHLADWIADPSGPPQRLLPGILAAVAQRMQQAA